MIAARQIHRKLRSLVRKIELENNPTVGQENPLPVDKFLLEMVVQKNAPRVVFELKKLGSNIWTKRLTAYFYAGIEQAFTAAARLPGSNKSGHSAEIRKLKAWVEVQANDPSRTVPKFFAKKTALLFAKGILDERRPVRIDVLFNIAHGS